MNREEFLNGGLDKRSRATFAKQPYCILTDKHKQKFALPMHMQAHVSEETSFYDHSLR